MKKHFVCVGPNTGDSSMFQMLDGHDEFWFIEPLPEAAAWLREQNRDISDVFHVVEAACSDYDGRGTLTRYNRNGVSSSLGKCSEECRALYGHVDWDSRGEVEVPVINLFNFLQYVGVHEIETLLIDAQGLDLTILKTLRPYLERRAIARIIHETDADGLRLYDDIPGNTIGESIEFFQSIGGYEMQTLPDRNAFNFDVEWRRV